ncbi:MAG: asparagine--tRNA ligase, partial [Finegoldia magna]
MILIRDLIKDYEKYSDKEVEVGGWIKNSRFSKNVGFIELNDGTFFNPVQIVVGKDNEDFEKSEKLKLSSAIIVVGKLVLTPNSKQPFEIQASKVIVEGESTDDYPLQKKRHTFEFLRTILHLRPRTNTFNAVFRVRSRLAFAIHKFFNERGFVYVHTPIITGSDAEGAGEMFRVTTLDLDNIPKDDDGNVDFSQDFFSKSTNLTVSGQLQAEAYALAFRNVYTFGPTFRSEHSNTPRHAAEFWMMEPEICFADLDDVCNLAEDMVRYIIKDVMENCEEEIKFFNSFVDKNLIERLTKVANKSFKKLTYTEAVEILQKSGEKFEYPVEWGM